MLRFILASLLILSPQAQPADITWKAVLMTGDDEIEAFDNARKALKNEFILIGLEPKHIRDLSMSASEIRRGIAPSSAENLQRSALSLGVAKGDGCIVHLTSHGTRQGFAMRNQPLLTPPQLDSILGQACGNAPTVVLVSACYSGSFTGGVMQKPNRVILTAARDDRTSFGCSPENQFTYWDGCLIDNLPEAETWQSLHGRIQRCIEKKEGAGRFTPSLPQAYFGEQVANLRLPGFSMAASPAAAVLCPIATDTNYGFSAETPIKVGLDSRETQYLSSLRGPAGQSVRSSRVGSVVSAGTILHIYDLMYEGLEKHVAIYVDTNHLEVPKAPVGFTCIGP